MSTYLVQIFNGLSVSSIFMLAALGLAITFGLMKVINMAHGEFIMLGAYTAYVVQKVFAQYVPANLFDIYFIVSIPLSFLVTAIIGYGLEKTVICRLYRRPLDSLLATWGVSIVLQQVARSVFGTPNVDVKAPSFLSGGFTLLGAIFPYKRLFIMLLVLVCFLLVYLVIYKSHFGHNMRAVMQNRSMAASLGINTRQIDAMTFAFGSGLAGIAGTALTLLGSIGPSLGTNYIVDTFMVVVLGGVGKLIGTVAGGLFIGMGNTSFEFLTNATMGKVIIFTLIILFLQWRPKGLFSLKTRSLDEE